MVRADWAAALFCAWREERLLDRLVVRWLSGGGMGLSTRGRDPLESLRPLPTPLRVKGGSSTTVTGGCMTSKVRYIRRLGG